MFGVVRCAEHVFHVFSRLSENLNFSAIEEGISCMHVESAAWPTTCVTTKRSSENSAAAHVRKSYVWKKPKLFIVIEERQPQAANSRGKAGSTTAQSSSIYGLVEPLFGVPCEFDKVFSIALSDARGLVGVCR